MPDLRNIEDLSLDDITEEKSDWRNEYMRVYFGLNSVVLEQTE